MALRLDLGLRATFEAKASTIAAFLAIVMLLVWLVHGDRNPWGNSGYVNGVVAQIREDDLIALRDDISAAARTIDAATKVNLNGVWQRGALNVYVIAGNGPKSPGWSIGGANYQPRFDVISIDRHVAWPYVTQPSFAGIRTFASKERSISDKLWLQFVFLHELGHRALHQKVRPGSIPDEEAKRRYEDEADAFALKHLATLVDPATANTTWRSLLSRNRISGLPEPDRTAAVIASLIQEFSVSLLFSNSTASTYYSDNAHKAFAARFKPRLHDLLLTTTTKEGRIFVLIALAAVERVEEAGWNIIAEVLSDAPILSASFNEKGLSATILQDSASGKEARVELARSSFLLNGDGFPKKIKLDTAAIAMATSAEAVHGGVRVAQEQSPGASEIRKQGPDERELIAQLQEQYGADLVSCRASSRVREHPFVDVAFTCSNGFFAGRYDVDGRKLVDVEQLLQPNSRDTATHIIYLADARIGGERRLFFIESTLSDSAHRSPHQLRVWRAHRGMPNAMGSIDLITDWIPAGSLISNWLEISHPPVLTCASPTEETAVCTEFLDSIFQVDLQTGGLGVLFYPAGVRRADDGQYFAFFAPGGFRLFIVRLGLRQEARKQLPLYNP